MGFTLKYLLFIRTQGEHYTHFPQVVSTLTQAISALSVIQKWSIIVNISKQRYKHELRATKKAKDFLHIKDTLQASVDPPGRRDTHPF